MKQHIITFSMVLAMLTVASPALAQDLDVRGGLNSGPGKARIELEVKMEERKASSTERRAEIKTNIEERKASSTAKRIELQQSIAKRMAGHASQMFSAMIERLEKLAERIQSRVDKVKAEGGVTTESERFLADAKIDIEQAKTSLRLFASIDLSADKLRDNFTKIREVGTEIKGHLKEAHQSLVKAIRALKPGAKVDARASTTVQTLQ